MMKTPAESFLFVRLCGQGSGICLSNSSCRCSSALLVTATQEASCQHVTCRDASHPSERAQHLNQVGSDAGGLT